MNVLPVPPSSLPTWLSDTLIVDIRPHTAYSNARIPHAISLSVPSTLLKRPLFSLDRLCAMLPSPSARARFNTWKSASRILVYDADSVSISESSNIYGLLTKFKKEGFTGELAWLQGGFQAVWKQNRSLLDTNPPSEIDEDEDDSAVLRPKLLPMSAFSLSSTTVKRPMSIALPLPAPAATSIPEARPAFNPFFDTVRQNTELSHGITERIPLRLPSRVRRRIDELPFRWLQVLARKAAKQSRPTTITIDDSDSNSNSNSNSSSEDNTDVEEGTEALAIQFYRIELAEQRRLMGVMEHHSRESGQDAATTTTITIPQQQAQPPGLAANLKFPFSITAGVEKGAKNRYRHIWPFEHARVRLYGEDDDDYVNASYVQPLGTMKRYIATQGPLQATFEDFWRWVPEQVVVISHSPESFSQTLLAAKCPRHRHAHA